MSQAADVDVVSTGLTQARAAGWDDFVSHHPDGTGYHRLAWLESIHSAYGHRPWCLLARSSEGNLTGVMPLCEFRVPLSGTRLISLPYCDLGGPLASSDTVAFSLREKALELVRQRGGKGLHLRLPGFPVDANDETTLPKVSMLCSLPDNSEALFASYKPKLRSQIRKAEKNGLRAEVCSGAEAISLFYQVFADNMHRLGSPVHSLRWFQDLQAAFGDGLKVGLVYLEDEVVGAGIVLVNGTRVSIPWASTLAEYNRLAPNMLLYWTLLAHVTDAGCRVFDFGRSTPGEGTYRFKKQWGAQPHELRWLDMTPDGEVLAPPLPNQPNRMRTLVESTWRRMPLSMANAVGPAVRKYISL